MKHCTPTYSCYYLQIPLIFIIFTRHTSYEHTFYNLLIPLYRAGTNITRSYTPVPRYYSPITSASNYMLLLVKAAGVFSQYITRDYPFASEIRISRPVGTFQLTSIKDHRRIALLAAGSGLTPMLGLLEYLLKRPANKL